MPQKFCRPAHFAGFLLTGLILILLELNFATGCGMGGSCIGWNDFTSLQQPVLPVAITPPRLFASR